MPFQTENAKRLPFNSGRSFIHIRTHSKGQSAASSTPMILCILQCTQRWLKIQSATRLGCQESQDSVYWGGDGFLACFFRGSLILSWRENSFQGDCYKASWSGSFRYQWFTHTTEKGPVQTISIWVVNIQLIAAKALFNPHGFGRPPIASAVQTPKPVLHNWRGSSPLRIDTTPPWSGSLNTRLYTRKKKPTHAEPCSTEAVPLSTELPSNKYIQHIQWQMKMNTNKNKSWSSRFTSPWRMWGAGPIWRNTSLK